ncbi:4'-phosphopantetheinyl transferase superfamily protein [Flavobacterium sp. GT3R68]|uniref:4'-phosphopantetheinyl transferase family protein n=1 Tax=Flavobacterium sp. GT3R68 TaxID=2594437 RepID=UPI000F866B6A|nr:4'-phosphopantetheinyl transferase superfamily protein [Flavobacterium sp. GT3R68]RTY93986.1 4'-phosphopantetheinyl transferase superfamily protein [Flavobacterium sp. GSN2]TRW93400.1 4'-phosphopantetheinyl transferase superfamily protein [Flavobacterium sp. GT3R68]
MPLHKIINVSDSIQVFVWKITESYEELCNEVELNERNIIRLGGMRSELQKRAFLSVRKLLHHIGYSDFDVNYDEFGKPLLKDGKHISITHSHEFSAIILSDVNIGIDMEMQREKIIRIADKFIDCEFNFLDSENENYIRKLTVLWGAKEAIFKVRNEAGISFKDHIKMDPFSMEDKDGTAYLHFKGIVTKFAVHFEEIENFTLVYAMESE